MERTPIGIKITRRAGIAVFFKHECFEFIECWRVCFLFFTTNYTNADNVRGTHCIRVIR